MSPTPFPSDITLIMPPNNLSQAEKHFLLEIPWDDKYLEFVPNDLKDFFVYILPHLHTRTTDVHTATCLQYLDEFIKAFPNEKINRRVVGISLILHDVGWSQLTQEEIAQSLGVSGLKLTPGAIGPKLKHAEEGVKLAQTILEEYTFTPPLSNDEKELILDAVRYHDRPEEVAKKGASIPREIQLLVDLDHIWSFIYEDFWLDTQRKGVAPQEYARNMAADIDAYFITEYGKSKAQKLLSKRQQEINNLLNN